MHRFNPIDSAALRRARTALEVLERPNAPAYSLARVLELRMARRPLDGFEAEVDHELRKAMPGSITLDTMIPGYLVAPELFRDFTIGTASEAGNLKQTDIADQVRPQLQSATVLQLGAQVVTDLAGDYQVARAGTAVTLSFLSEMATASEVNPATSIVTATPRRTGGYVQVSRQALIQAPRRAEVFVRETLNRAVNALIDTAAISGSGSAPNPRGIRNVSGIGSVVGGTNGANLSLTILAGLEHAVGGVNAEGGPSGFLVNSTTRRYAKLNSLWNFNTPATPLIGLRAAVSNAIPSNLTKGTSSGVCSNVTYSGDWTALAIAVFGPGFDIIVDPYTQKANGMVEIAVNAYLDTLCLQPASFATCDDVLTP